MSKYTINDVKKYVYDITNGECEVISDKYINYTTKLEIKCKCGKMFYKDFEHIKRNRTTRFQCEDCLRSELSMKNRTDMAWVIDYINFTGCEYISGEYINNKSILNIKCRCGNIFNKSFSKFKSGQDRCRECGLKSSAQSKIKYTADYVQEVVNKERGYNIEKDKYISSNRYVPCTCSIGHKFNLRFDWYLRGQSGCHKCQVVMQQGENSPRWKGGENEVVDNIRKSIKDWKMEVMAYYGFKCSITGEHEDSLAVHHLKSFSTILNEVSEKIKIPVLRKIKDYEDINNFYKLKSEVVKAHTIDNGIVLKRNIHNAFHDEYGRGENTSEQFNEFLINNYQITLDQIQKERKSNMYIPKVS